MTNNSRLYAFVVLPTIIDGPGEYITRSGECICVTDIIMGPLGLPHSAKGIYQWIAVHETWDISGRILPSTLTPNDIVSKVD
jgi:hypothetical protein